MRSVSQRWNHDAESRIRAADLAERNGIAIRTDQMDRERRDRFVEGEPQHRWRLRDDSAIGRLGLHQRGMRSRSGHRPEERERQCACRDDGCNVPAHGRAG